MDGNQRLFYLDLERRLDQGEAPGVDGEVGYLFVYAYKLIVWTPVEQYANLEDRLFELHEAYATREPKFADYTWRWGLDAMLAQGKREKYLGVTVPSDIFAGKQSETVRRLNVQLALEMPADPDDLFAMTPYTLTEYTKD